MESPKVVGIIGTGDYGRALAIRLLRCGYDVIMGSRKPNHARLTDLDERLNPVKVKSIKEVLGNPAIEIVFLAIHSWNFDSCLSLYRNEIQDKIVVDISIPKRPSKTESNAEKLVRLFPALRVVKAFNTVSPYSFGSDSIGGAKQVLIAGDDSVAKDKVSNLAREMGFIPIDYGVLKTARKLESSQLTMMAGWGYPTFFTLGIFLGWIIVVILTHIFYHNGSTEPFDWSLLPVFYLNKPVCLTAITLLAMTYLPGCLASFLQIINGTKYKEFPKLIDQWLKFRRMFGRYTILFAIWHVVMSGDSLSPNFKATWFESTKVSFPANTSGYVHDFAVKMSSTGAYSYCCAVMGFIVILFLGVTSLPSVVAVMNWREWRFVQSHLGYVALFFCTTHVIIMGLPEWMGDPMNVFQRHSFWCLVIPVICLFMKFVLLTPCVSGRVNKIREGWERRSALRYSDDLPLN